MKDIKKKESDIILKKGKKGKLVIFTYVGQDDPVEKLDIAVSKYVGSRAYMQFVDIHMDNPWIRVVIFGTDQMEEGDFQPSKLF